jgi:hypothetical protein
MSDADSPPLIFKIELGMLRPANDMTREAMRGLTGEVRVRITKVTANVRRLNWYWTMLKLAADNMADKIEGGLTAKLLHRILKRKLDLGRTITLPSGEKFFDEESIGFATMPETDRIAWVQRVQSTLSRWLGVDPMTLGRETDERNAA